MVYLTKGGIRRMRLFLQRHKTRPELGGDTPGTLFLDPHDNGRFCYTLEDELRENKVHGETAIPAGEYELELVDSPKFGPNTLSLMDVPGFSLIRIHALNDDTETQGCIGVGRVLSGDKILHSGATLRRLKALVVPALRLGQRVTIFIRNFDGDVYVDTGNPVPNTNV